MRTSPRNRLAVTAGAFAVLTSVTAAPATADGSSPMCRRITAKVAIAPGQPADQHIAGTLCVPRHRTATTVQLLLPGGFYGQAYWQLRGDPRRPSYAETMTGAGYATLAIDRLGTGRSSHPPSG